MDEARRGAGRLTLPAGRLLPLCGALALGALQGCSAPADAPMRAHEMSLAIAPQGPFAAWHGGTGAGSAIYIQPLAADGKPAGAPIRVNKGERLAYEPDLIAVGGSLAVAWYERDPRDGRLSAWLAGVEPSGEGRWLVELGDGKGQARNPVVRRVGDTLHAAWIAESDGGRPAVMHRRFSLDGAPRGEAMRVGDADADTWNLNAAVSEGRLLVTYDAAGPNAADEIQLLSISDEGAAPLQLTADDGFASLYPDLQVSDAGRAALTWFDERDGNREVYLLVTDAAALGSPALPAPRRITHGEGETIGAYLAWNGDTIGLVWSDEVDGRRDIYGQVFSADGRPIGPAENLSRSADRSSIPAIRPWGSGFLVAWNDYRLDDGGGHEAVTRSTARYAILGGG